MAVVKQELPMGDDIRVPRHHSRMEELALIPAQGKAATGCDIPASCWRPFRPSMWGSVEGLKPTGRGELLHCV